ncbi:MAG: hypothetical protein LBC71_07115 [Oscillospiraceae bacterium]|jgi:hypothetical protein|nr:hypothetical protein [Oscillospiraceae bacterium]
MTKEQLLGSKTAKKGFSNERDITVKFNNWKIDKDAQDWLILMNYNLDRIEYVKAVVIHGHKADINVQISIKLKTALDVENIQIKLVSNQKGFNQIDKRPVDRYKELWNIPDNIVSILKRFTGELLPNISHSRDARRMFIDEFSDNEQIEMFDYLNKNRTLIVSDILRGRGEFAAEWIIVAQKKNQEARWVLKNINEVMNHYNGLARISSRGSILIGKILVQRKGGTPDPTSLQFKINPAELFYI